MNPTDRDLLAHLLLRWEELYERGQDTPAGELAREHSHLAPELLRRINALKTVSWIQRPADDDPPDDGPLFPPSPPRALLNRYRLEELIAEGGFARVYRAFDQELQRIVAVKLPKPERLHSTEAFLAEARRVARLKHDGIVAVYDCGIANDSCFIVSEFMDGGSLADRIVTQKPRQEDAIRWVTEVAEALDFAHRNGVIHRDIKPANILIDQHGRAKLADFGIAQSATKSGDFAPSLGTLRYMAPEALQGAVSEPLADIFSLGMVLHEALTGKLPYSGSEPSAIRREIVEGRVSVSSSIPGPLSACIRKATSRNPHLRHASSAEFASQLRRLTGKSSRFAASLGLAALALSALVLVPMVQSQQPAMQPAVKESPPAEPDPTDRITLSGLGPRRFLEGTVPASWVRQGVFAEISTPGTAEFPRIQESAYVMEADLVIENPHGRMTMFMGEPNCSVEICMGDLWEQDKTQDKIATRLFRRQPFGVNWSRETHFEPNQRMSLTLVVADDDQVLFRDGEEVLRAKGEPTDFCLRITAVDGAHATFHSLSCRALTSEDARKANVQVPFRQLRCDTDSATKRVKSQIPDEWPRKPVPETDFVLSSNLAMRWIPPAEFTMGSPDAKYLQFGQGTERVRFSRGYWIGAYEVTQGQWQELLGDNPSRVTGSPLLPVNQISWSDAGRFCISLTERERQAGRLPDGYEYRLPTEAEWEYAGRAGTDREYVVPLEELAYRFGHLVEVGTTPANPWGLYEVLGNVAEWCLDQWREYPKNQESATVDRFHEGDPSRTGLIVRGHGFWYTDLPPTVFVRAPRHDIAGGYRGFRVVLGPIIPLRHAGMHAP